MRLFWRDGRRWTAEQLHRYGVAEGREAEAGFLPLDASQPAHDPLFDLPVDRGTIISATEARIDWAIEERQLDAVRADLVDRVTKTAAPLLDAVDTASIRPLRATAAGTATDTDAARLAELDARAAAIRRRQGELLTAIAAATDVATLRILDIAAGWAA